MGRLLGPTFLFLAVICVPLINADSSLRGDKYGKLTKRPKMITLFSVECKPYFDWQTVGLMHSFRKSRQPGPIMRLLSCTEENLKDYKHMDLAPTHVVPSLSHHPLTGDDYTAINKPAGVVHWLENNPAAKEVEWVLILDADMIIRQPVTPWGVGAQKGYPVAAEYGYLIGCDTILAKLHTLHPELCDKVGGFIVMHIDDLRRFAPLWLSKTVEVRADTDHYATNITGDIYGQGWISEMYGYSFGAADAMLKHKVDNDLMLYPGYIPAPGIEPHLLHYGLEFKVKDWLWGKAYHTANELVDKCRHLFPAPPRPHEVVEDDEGKLRAALLSIECVDTINEGVVLHHATHGCPSAPDTAYIRLLKKSITQSLGSFDKLVAAYQPTRATATEAELAVALQSVTFARAHMAPLHEPTTGQESQVTAGGDKLARTLDPELPAGKAVKKAVGKGLSATQPWRPQVQLPGKPRIATLFSTECSTYFDWQTLGLMYSWQRSGQPGDILRLLSCSPEDLAEYKGMDLAPTLVVPSWNKHPLTGDWYPAINKPVGVNYWLNNSPLAQEVDWIVILDADMILRRPITPWELDAKIGRPVSSPYDYLIGCDNVLGRLHMKDPSHCDKVGGFIVMHIDDLRRFAPLWLSKTEEVRADTAHYATNITGDIYAHGWISEMYGYAFGASDAGLRHRRDEDVMFYPGYIPRKGLDPRVFHYGLPFDVLNWHFDKAKWHNADLALKCRQHFPDPPQAGQLPGNLTEAARQRDLFSIETVSVLNRALKEYHLRKGCDPKGEEDVEGLMDLGGSNGRNGIAQEGIFQPLANQDTVPLQVTKKAGDKGAGEEELANRRIIAEKAKEVGSGVTKEEAKNAEGVAAEKAKGSSMLVEVAEAKQAGLSKDGVGLAEKVGMVERKQAEGLQTKEGQASATEKNQPGGIAAGGVYKDKAGAAGLETKSSKYSAYMVVWAAVLVALLCVARARLTRRRKRSSTSGAPRIKPKRVAVKARKVSANGDGRADLIWHQTEPHGNDEVAKDATV